jgi:capsular polysaccharide transport system permease protein
MMPQGFPTIRTAAKRQWQVIMAAMLRGIRSRFFSHGLGYLIAIAWPVTHILILVFIFSAAGRAPPFGDSPVLFVATGAVPFIVFSYLARFMMIGVINFKPLLSLPEVKLVDILIASAALETLSVCAVTIIMIILGVAFDIQVRPNDMAEAFFAIMAAVLLGLGMGFLNSAILMLTPMWMTGYTLINICMWAASGVMFVPDHIPEPYRTWLSYNPVLQCVEWMRSAYYDGYGHDLLDKPYTIGWGVGTLFLGLLLERVIRGYALSLRG